MGRVVKPHSTTGVLRQRQEKRRRSRQKEEMSLVLKQPVPGRPGGFAYAGAAKADSGLHSPGPRGFQGGGENAHSIEGLHSVILRRT